MSQRLRLVYAMLAAVVISLGLAGGAIAGSSLPSSPQATTSAPHAAVFPPEITAGHAAEDLCSRTRIAGVIENHTDHEIHLAHFGHGVTNAWCKRPSEAVAAHGHDDWIAGDNIFGTHVLFIYDLPGNKVKFDALIKLFPTEGAGSTTPAGCRFMHHAVANHRLSKDERYSCHVKLTPPGGAHIKVRFVLSKRS
jgi:hypothetical protein